MGVGTYDLHLSDSFLDKGANSFQTSHQREQVVRIHDAVNERI